MRILFGVQCTGNGHISRSRELVSELKALGHDVRCVLTGRDPAELREIDVFRPFVSFRGLSFSSARGKVQRLRTALSVPSYMLQLWRDVAACDASGVDVVVTDFEPVTARVAKRHHIPSIGFGHQYAFVHRVPRVRSDPVSRYILRNMARADIPVGLHWHHFESPILPPVVPDNMPTATRTAGKILAYLPFEASADIVAALRDHTGFEFFIYGSTAPPSGIPSLHFRPYSRDGFLADLADCDGVICNAGFELPSEALHLGKRLLVKPLAGQLEQRSNALALEKLGLGHVMQMVDREVIARWLPDTNRPAAMNYPRTAAALARWIDAGRWDDLGSLADELWKGVPTRVSN